MTESRAARLDITNRTLSLLSRCNAALVRAEDESALLNEICRIAVEIGGYRMASVLFTADDELKSVIPVGHAGADDGYLDKIFISSAADRPEGRGPVGKAIRDGHAVVVSDLTIDPEFAPWLGAATARGYRSAVALPLAGGGRVFGALALYSSEAHSVSESEQQLLGEIANNLAFGILKLRAEAERRLLLDSINLVSKSAAGRTGTEYLQQLLLALVEVLSGCAGFIAEDTPPGLESVHPLCAVVDGRLIPDFEYSLAGTPCADMRPGGTLIVTREVCTSYPAAKALAALGCQAYAGASLIDVNGHALGTIFVLFRQPLAHPDFAASLLDLVATRVAGELIRRRTDARLREQAMLLDRAQDAIFLRSLDHRILYWNKGAERLYGWSADEATGRSVLDFKVGERAAFVQAMDQLLRDGAWIGEQVENAKDGRKLAVECHWTLMTAEDGVPQSILAINRDVTELRKSEQQLRLLENAVARLNDMVIITEAESIDEPGPRILFCNDALPRITGYSREELIGYSPRRLQGAQTSRVELDRIRQALQNFQPVRAELINYKRNGDPFWLELDIVPLTDAAGRCTHFVSVQRDVTERKRSEERLRESEARLMQSQKLESIGQLTGGIAHDFNNLLTVIIGSAESLTEQLASDPKLSDLAQMAKSAGERGAELTNRLLAFARKQALEPRSTQPWAIVHDMMPLLRRTLPETVRIETAPDAGTWPIFVDPGQLESALLNLCINARDAMPQGGALLFETANTVLDKAYCDNNAEVRPGEYVMVAVADTGVGIAAEDLPRVFDPFFTTKSDGTGLGLSMVYGFAKQSGGHVKVYSERGMGTVVKLYLPRADTTESPAAQSTPAETDLRGQGVILLVEDDDLVRNHAVRALEEMGYSVLHAANGAQALQIVQSGASFDLLFTDVVMPGGMNGPQLAAEVATLRPGVPVLFTSGYTENAIVHHNRVDAGVHLLHKPYTRRKLAEMLRRLLRSAEEKRRK